MSEPVFDASAEGCCPQCGAVATAQWQRADGVTVCDNCWVEMGPPKLPKPHFRYIYRRTRRCRRNQKEREK